VELKLDSFPLVAAEGDSPNRTRVELKPDMPVDDTTGDPALIEPEWN